MSVVHLYGEHMITIRKDMSVTPGKLQNFFLWKGLTVRNEIQWTKFQRKYMTSSFSLRSSLLGRVKVTPTISDLLIKKAWKKSSAYLVSQLQSWQNRRGYSRFECKFRTVSKSVRSRKTRKRPKKKTWKDEELEDEKKMKDMDMRRNDSLLLCYISFFFISVPYLMIHW